MQMCDEKVNFLPFNVSRVFCGKNTSANFAPDQNANDAVAKTKARQNLVERQICNWLLKSAAVQHEKTSFIESPSFEWWNRRKTMR